MKKEIMSKNLATYGNVELFVTTYQGEIVFVVKVKDFGINKEFGSFDSALEEYNRFQD